MTRRVEEFGVYQLVQNLRGSLFSFFIMALLAVAAENSIAAERVLEEVIVSAQKKPQSLQDVPASVSSFDSDFLRNIGASDVGEIVKYTPNVKFDGANASTVTLTIRGYGTPPLAVGLEPSVGLVIDGISYGRSNYIIDSIYDIARLEVLRGPQGTLFGKNTIAGVMNVISNDASYEWDGYLALTKNSVDESRIEAAQSFTLIDEVLAGRLAIRTREKTDEFYNTAKDKAGTAENFAARIKLHWDVTDNLGLNLNAAKANYKSREPIFQLSHASARSLAVFAEHDARVEADATNNTLSANAKDFGNRVSESIEFKLEYAFPDQGIFQEPQLVVIGGWSETSTEFAFDGDFSPVKFIDFGSVVPDFYDQNQLEVRFSADIPAPFGWGRGVELMAGIFGNSSKATTSSQQTVYFSGLLDFYRAGTPIFNGNPKISVPELLVGALGIADLGILDNNNEAYFAISESQSESYALFTNMEWHINDTISAILGLRYSEDTRDGRVASGPLQDTSLIGEILGYETFDEDLTGSDYNFSYRTTLSWRPDDEHSLFVSVAEGFKTGGFAVGVYDTRNLNYEAETGLSYEVGSKNRLFDNSLSLNLTMFYTQFNNLQARDFDGQAFLVSNASDAVSYGLEMDFMWLPPVEWLTIGGGAGFINAKYIDYQCGPGDPSATGGSGPEECEQLGSGVNSFAYTDFSGEPLPFAPTPTVSLFVNSHLPITGSIVLLGGFDVLYQGEQTPGAGKRFESPAVTKINVRLGIMSGAGFSLMLHGKNITAESEVLWSFDQTMMPGNYISAVAKTETVWQLELRYDWGSEG